MKTYIGPGNIFVLLMIIFLVTFSCAPDPEITELENWNIKFDNGVPRIFPGEKIDVTVSVNDNLLHKQEEAKVFFEDISGGGTVSDESLPVAGSKAITTWSPGNESYKSVLRASVFKISGKEEKFLASRDLEAYNFIPGKLIRITDSPEKRITDMVADTISKFTIAIFENQVYRQGERYYQWNKIEEPLIENARTIDIDKNNFIYITTWNGNVVKSNDHGLHWTMCTKPYPDVPFFIYFTVSNDGWLWAGRNQYPVKYSKDGGVTWITAGGNLSPYLNGNVFRLKSGEIVFHGTNKPDHLRLNISRDDGLTWTVRETPGYSVEMYVDENDRIYISTQEGGRTIYRTTDLGLTYEKVVSVGISFNTSVESNIFYKRGNTYFIAVPGGSILRSTDLQHFDYVVYLNEIREVFMDHSGTFIGKGQDYQSIYYYRNPGP